MRIVISAAGRVLRLPGRKLMPVRAAKAASLASMAADHPAKMQRPMAMPKTVPMTAEMMYRVRSLMCLLLVKTAAG